MHIKINPDFLIANSFDHENELEFVTYDYENMEINTYLTLEQVQKLYEHLQVLLESRSA